MKIYTLKDNEGELRPQAFLCYPDMLKYTDTKKLTKDGSTIVLVEILEVKTCDNTDHDQEKEARDVRTIELTEEFEGDICDWCEDCRARDYTMIEKILRN